MQFKTLDLPLGGAEPLSFAQVDDLHIGAPHLAASVRDVGNPLYENYDEGFRVATVPEPGEDLLLVAGVLGLALARLGCRAS